MDQCYKQGSANYNKNSFEWPGLSRRFCYNECESPRPAIEGAGYVWAGPAFFYSSISSPSILNANETHAGNYSVFAVLGNCKSSVQSTGVLIHSLPLVDLGMDTAMCDNSSILLSPGNNFTSYLWQDNSKGNDYYANKPGTYSVMVKDANGCFANDSISILLSECDSLFPDIFTPNGDGANDNFIINAKAIENLHVIIFNRWGQKLYEWYGTEGYWNGKIKSEQAPDGTYFYIVEYDDIINNHQTPGIFSSAQVSFQFQNLTLCLQIMYNLVNENYDSQINTEAFSWFFLLPPACSSRKATFGKGRLNLNGTKSHQNNIYYSGGFVKFGVLVFWWVLYSARFQKLNLLTES